ncbi:MAG: acyl--CoA ligase [Desulfarculaceae bacterium]|nr:acyl--CoA ligase [Desulfarculaceae bacterium]MCF8074496.1 acyl--CoA ligase [Desulfarculaceae bacterium]MCF8103595.1 acyl--CoA ligase [Desulfarculaceae bacterium]MCF8118385.1 acyl--CoA ligase [Desulfarculaceae bacterium]
MESALPRVKKPSPPTMITMLRSIQAKNPHGPALIFDNETTTWRQMWLRSNRLANGLLSLGMQKADRVMVLMSNCPQFPEAALGIAKAGCATTLCNYRLTPAEIQFQINKIKARAVIVRALQYELVKQVRDQTPSLEQVIFVGQDCPRDCTPYEDFLAANSDQDPAVEVLAEDINTVMFTSGTTGLPKASARTHGSTFMSFLGVSLEHGLAQGGKQLVAAPMYAAAAYGFMSAGLLSGVPVVIMPSFDPPQVLRAIAEHQIAWTFMVPIMWDWLLDHADEMQDPPDATSLVLALSCGAPLHNRTVKRVMAHFPNSEMANWLGASELGFVSNIRFSGGLKGEGCIGQPAAATEMALFDQQGQPVAPGEVGILYVRGIGTFEGYWDDQAGTREAILDNTWVTVGDMARQDQEGDFYLVDRAKDMIITGGTNVYPAEVEQVLMEIQGVGDAAVIGVPDQKWGESVKAVVVLAPGSELDEAAIIAQSRQHLAGFKAPKSVDFVEAIPRSLIGKALKNKLREKYWPKGESNIS